MSILAVWLVLKSISGKDLSISGAFMQDNIEERPCAGHSLHVQNVLNHLHLMQLLLMYVW